MKAKNLHSVLAIATALIFSFSFSGSAAAQSIFQKTIGGPGSESAYQVKTTSDGGFIITGDRSSVVGGNLDIYLVKTDAEANILWTKTYGGSGYDIANSVTETSDGGYLIAGQGLFASGGTNIYIIRTDANGDTLWTRQYASSSGDVGLCVAATEDAGCIIAGFIGNPGPSSEDAYLIKIDSGGTMEWTKSYGGTGREYANSVQQTSDGGYIFSGYTESVGAGDKDVYLVKTDNAGDTLWTRAFGGPGIEEGYTVMQTADGGYFVSGQAPGSAPGYPDMCLLRTDANGDTLWTKTIGSVDTDYAMASVQSPDGGFCLVGFTNGFGVGSPDMFMVKTNANGSPLWAKTFGGSGDDKAFSVCNTPDGGYLLAGNTFSFGAGSYDMYLVKTDAQGNSGCNEGAPSVIVTSPTMIVNSAALPVANSGSNAPAGGTIGTGGSAMTLCISTDALLPAPTSEIDIYPNPSAGVFRVSVTSAPITEIEVCNALGETVFVQKEIHRFQADIDMSTQASGIYFVRIRSGAEVTVRRVLVK